MRPSWRRRLAVLAVLPAVGLLVAAVDVGIDRGDAPVSITKVETTGTASYDPGQVDATTFVLVIGSDERPGLSGARADALHVVGLNPGANQASVLNIPRDTWVPIPGHGMGRVNSAYTFGGAELQAQTVRDLTGVPISLVLATTFPGMVAMVDALGGIEVDVPIQMDDPNSGAFFSPGPQVLNGTQSLAFTRNRAIPTGDIARTSNQGQFIVHALSKLRADGSSGTDVLRYVEVLFRNVRVDGVGPTDLYRLGRAALAVDPGRVRNFTMPARIGNAGSASVIFATESAGAVFADFADDAVLQAH